MFVSKEKYASALEEISQLKSLLEEKQGEIESLNQSVKDLTEQNSVTDPRTQEEFQSLVTEKDATIAELSDKLDAMSENIGLTEQQLAEANTKISDLQGTIEKLNNDAYASPALAVSQGDGTSQNNGLNEFISQNINDTQACIARLRSEGF